MVAAKVMRPWDAPRWVVGPPGVKKIAFDVAVKTMVPLDVPNVFLNAAVVAVNVMVAVDAPRAFRIAAVVAVNVMVPVEAPVLCGGRRWSR